MTGLDGRITASAPCGTRAAPYLLIGSVCLGAAVVGIAGWAPAFMMVPAAALAAVVIAAIARGRPVLALGGLALLLFTASAVWSEARLGATAPPPLGGVQLVEGRVSIDGPTVESDDGTVRVRVRVEHLVGAHGQTLPHGARLLARLPAGSHPRLGEIGVVAGRVGRPAAPTAPGWWRRYLERQRIAGGLTVERYRAVGQRGGVAGLRDRWRIWTRERAGAGLDGDRRAVVRGMALGAVDDLSDRSAREMRDAGVWHLLAVSGQNVTVVAMVVLGLLRALGAARRAAVVGAIVALVAYAVACDGGPSVGRAAVVGAVGLTGELRSVERARWHLLLVALAALLLADPRSVGDPGLHLSFAAVVGLFVTAPPVTAALSGWLPDGIARLAGLAAGAGLATAPVVVWHFERLSLVGFVANVVAVPLAAPVVVIALLGIAVSALWAPLGVLVAAVAGWGGQTILWLAALSAAVPGAAVDLPRWVALPLLPVAALPHVLRAMLVRIGATGRRAAVLGLGAALAGALVLSAPSPEPWPDRPEVRVLSVGQGNAALLRSPTGAAALIDTGPPGDPAPLDGRLEALGVRRVDLLVLSHGSLDHVGGLDALLARATPDRVVMGPEIPPAQAGALRRRFRAMDVPVRVVQAGHSIRVGPWRVEVVAPRRGGYRGGDPNPRSLVLRVRAPGITALLCADAESGALDGVALGPVDLLMVAHHGSADPGLPGLLERVRPAVAAISVGGDNRYGHPAPATVAALEYAGATVLRTDRHGDISLRGSR